MREKRVVAVAGAVTLIALLAVAYMVIQPSGVLTFHGGTSTMVGDVNEGMILEVEVSGWVPIGPWVMLAKLVGDAFWIIDGTKYDTVAATLKVKLTYYGIKVGSLNATIIELWCEYSSKKSYIINADPINSINTATDGVYNRYDSNPFTGSKSVNDTASELSLPTDGNAYTVNYRYRVQFKGTGVKSGNVYTADTYTKNPTPASGSWQWYTESAGSPSTSGSVSYSSWADLVGVGVLLGVVFAVIVVARRRAGRRAG